jgi:hypothetical protein
MLLVKYLPSREFINGLFGRRKPWEKAHSIRTIKTKHLTFAKNGLIFQPKLSARFSVAPFRPRPKGMSSPLFVE